MNNTIHLGYEVGTGHPVEIPLKHLAVTGQTQESGKTTTLEALVTRSKLKAICFVTKRGEKSFEGGRRILPYFRDRADWQFVDQLLEAQLREKNKFLRPWLIRICRHTRTLADVQREVRKSLAKAKGFNEGIYTQLDAYLELIVPQIGRARLAESIDLAPGLNVMDISAYPAAMQMLFVQSAIDWVNERERDVVTIVPEAWEFIPEGRGSPVKASAVSLVRKGAALRNLIWADSQDMAGVDKTILRGCAVWLIGVQRESNEVKRNLANIPANIKRPKQSDVMGLELGQFFACWGTHVVKAYVQPAWMAPEEAHAIAMGCASTPRPPAIEVNRGGAEPAEKQRAIEPVPIVSSDFNRPDGDSLGPEWTEVTGEFDIVTDLPLCYPPLTTHHPPDFGDEEMSAAAEAKLDEVLELLKNLRGDQIIRHVAAPSANGPATDIDEEQLYQRFKARLAKEAPALLKVLVKQPELEVEVETVTLTADGKSLRGRLALLIRGGFFSELKKGNAVWVELTRTGSDPGKANVYRELGELVKLGFLTREGDEGYKAVPEMKVNIVKK